MEKGAMVFPFPIAVSCLFIIHIFANSVSGSLVSNFYAASCPNAELIVRNTVSSSSSSDPSIPGKLLRLVFHDCFVEELILEESDLLLALKAFPKWASRYCGVQLGPKFKFYKNLTGNVGCDASLMLLGNNTEKSDPANRSVGGFSVIESAKRVLEFLCPGTVSCADIIALAARDAVEIVGGPMIEIPTGRRDGMVSVASNVRPNILDTSFTMDEMINRFSSKGLSLFDLVILSGAHTIGTAHCSSFRDRFQEDSKGKLTLIDKTLDNTYADELMKECPLSASPSVSVNNDPETSMIFDNQYYRNLLTNKGLFQSDSALLSDNRTRKFVEDLANDQEFFFESWGQSFLKLTSIGVKTGDEGEIRSSCASINA